MKMSRTEPYKAITVAFSPNGDLTVSLLRVLDVRSVYSSKEVYHNTCIVLFEFSGCKPRLLVKIIDETY